MTQPWFYQPINLGVATLDGLLGPIYTNFSFTILALESYENCIAKRFNPEFVDVLVNPSGIVYFIYLCMRTTNVLAFETPIQLQQSHSVQKVKLQAY
jgi:hypothetical protein